MSLDKEFAPYDLALELKQLGFDEPCFAYYIELRNPSEGILTIDKCENNIDGVLAPTFSQAFRWFRDVHNIDAWVQPFVMNLEIGRIYLPDETYSYFIFKDGEFIQDGINFDEPEDAELACLRKLIAIVKNK